MVNVTIENIFHLRARVENVGKLNAFYLYRGNEIVDKTPYSESPSCRFILDARGIYSVRAYSKSPGGPAKSVMSNKVRFSGLPALPASPQRSGIVVYGIDRVSMFAARVLSRTYKILGYFDPNGINKSGDIFGIPILDELPNECTIVCHENFKSHNDEKLYFSLSFGRDDILSNELNKMGTIGLYKISREAYLDGLIEGAKFLHGFIRIKYACRAPYTAKIGDGTILSLSGLGTAIHPATVIGQDCTIGQNVTLGGRSGKNSAPVIGNNVFVGPGAICIGGAIGNNVVIGANSVVIDEIPDNCVVAGVPAKIVSRDIQKYRSYTHNPRR